MQAIELLARTRRRNVIEQRARRWTRTGSAVVALEGKRGFARIDLESAQIERALRGEDPSDLRIRIEGSRRQVLSRWRSMARLEEHGITAPRCQVLITKTAARAWFALQPARAAANSADLGFFVGQMLDRGLWCEQLEPRDLDGAGLVRPLLLTTLETSAAPARLAPWLRGLDGDARRQFFSGLREAWHGPARERDALLANLEHA